MKYHNEIIFLSCFALAVKPNIGEQAN